MWLDVLQIQGLDPAILAAAIGLMLTLPISLLAIVIWNRQSSDQGALSAEQIDRLAQGRRLPDLSQQVNQSFERLVQRTGLELTSAKAIGYMLMAGLVGALATILLQEDWMLTPIGFFVGILSVLGLLLMLQSRWRESIRRELPDSLHLAARSVRAGLNLDQTIAVLASQAESPLTREFGAVAQRVSMGVPLEQALRLSALKIKLPDFDLLAAGLALHRRIGGDIATLLLRLAGNARERHLARGQFRASTALGRTSAVFLALGGPILLLLNRSSQPESFSRFIQSSGGQLAMGIALALEFVGVVWIMLILRQDD